MTVVFTTNILCPATTARNHERKTLARSITRTDSLIINSDTSIQGYTVNV